MVQAGREDAKSRSPTARGSKSARINEGNDMDMDGKRVEPAAATPPGASVTPPGASGFDSDKFKQQFKNCFTTMVP